MPNTNVATGPDAIVEALPGGDVSSTLRVRISMKVLRAAPVLENSDVAAGEHEPTRQQSQGRLRLLFFQHWRHLEQYRQPAPDFPQLIDAHADREDNHVIVYFCGKAFSPDVIHDPSLSCVMLTPSISANVDSVNLWARTIPMGYHHGDARTALLKTAAGLLEEKGAAGLSLRQVAEAAGLSRQAPYNHFASKEALLADLAAEGFVALTKRMNSTSDDTNPFERLVAAGEGYIGFATQHPALFRLMFGRELVDLRRYPGPKAVADQAFALLSTIIASMAPPTMVDELRLVAWSLVHGYAELCLETEFEEPSRRTERARLFARAVFALAAS